MSIDCTTTSTTLARPIAPDDLRRGEYVAVLHEVAEVPSFFWCCDSGLLNPHEPVSITYRPLSKDRVPLKVIALCLPFVLVEHPDGEHRTLDIRGCQLARLDKEYARVAWKGMKKKGRRKRKS